MLRLSVRVRAVLGALMAGGILALAACGSASTGTSAASTAATGTSPGVSIGTGATTSAANANQQAQQIVQKVQQLNLQSANITLTTTLTTTDQRASSSSGSGQVMLHPTGLELTTTSNDNSRAQTQEVIANDSLYVKRSGQKTWTRYTLPANSTTSAAATSMSAPYVSLQNVGQLQQVQLVGVEYVNGVQTYHLHGLSTQGANGQTGSYAEELWVSTQGSEPQKMSVQAQTGSGQLSATAIYTHWNQGQSITLPPANQVTSS